MMSSLAMGNAFSAVEHLGAAVSDLEKVREISETGKAGSEKVLEPDMGLIKGRSLESIAGENLEKAEAKSAEAGSEKVLDPDMELVKGRNIESIAGENLEKAASREVDETGLRPLTDTERARVQEATHMSDKTLNRCTIGEDGTVHLSCINEDKVNESGFVPYREKTIEIGGVKIKVVVPEFPDDVFETRLLAKMHTADDPEVFSYCTEKLKQAIAKNPELASKFTEEQLDQIKSGAPRIKGYTWHHCAEPGRMQLVRTDEHEQYRHTGGKTIWGGGRS